MARIRSVHPSLFTDEAWVSCSPLARILYIGLLTDADDQGLFEWKPLQIRMRLLPGDNADVGDLLAELAGVNLIAPLESGGKKLGAIRYFRRFQRPKKPNSTFLLPAEWGTYVGLSGDSSEPDDDDDPPVPKKSELGPQMEDGGGRREKSNLTDSASAIDRAFLDGLESRLREAGGNALNPTSTKLFVLGPILGLLKPGDGPACDLEADVLPVIRAAAGRAKPSSIGTWAYFTAAITEARDQRLSGGRATPTLPKTPPSRWSDDQWRAALQIHAETGRWSDACGPRPGEPECRVPGGVLREFVPPPKPEGMAA